MARLEQLLELVKADPDDAFARYGVAMEYRKAGRFQEAIETFTEVIRRDPDYVAAYFMGGQTFEQNGDVEGAKRMYKRGVETARRVGDSHAAGEIGQALAMLE